MSHRYIIDFYPGSHGHFLEYVVNVWIFNGPRVSNIFTDIGTCHGTYKDAAYVKSKRIVCNHFSEWNIAFPDGCEKIVRITADSFFESCCLQINVINRAGDIPKHIKEQALSESILQNVNKIRNDYFSKFVDNEYNSRSKMQWIPTSLPTFELSMKELYDLRTFFTALQRMAKFLERKFNPDIELVSLWEHFIKFNHGVKSWQNANTFVTCTLMNKEQEIFLNVEEQALANALFSQTLNIHNGELFDTDNYPSNTLDAYRILNK